MNLCAIFMTCFSNKDLELLQELFEQQYQSLDLEDDLSEYPEDSWIPAEPYAKQKLSNNHHSSIDVLNLNREKIEEAIFKYTTIKIGSFLVRIKTYSNKVNIRTDKNKTKNSEIILNIECWHKIDKTPSGFPCSIEKPFNLKSDPRFTHKTWLAYFTEGSKAYRVPSKIVVEIIRHFQVLHKLPAFS